MGQRLVIQIKKNNPFYLWGEEREILATIYYHWSGYSTSALQETMEIIKCIKDTKNKEKDLILRLIHFLESKGGGITGGEGSKEWNYITDKYPKESFEGYSISRNNGLIAISPYNIDDSISWAEEEVIINVDTEKVIDNVFFHYEDIDTINEYRQESMDEAYEPLKKEDVPELSVNPDDLSYDDVSILYNELLENTSYYFRYAEEIYELIA